MTGVSILGAGAFGTALAISLAQDMRPVTLWARDADHARETQHLRQNLRRLKDVPFPTSLQVTNDLRAATTAQTLLLTTPMQQLRDFLAVNAAVLDGKRLVACCKGVDLETGLGPIALIRAACPSATAAILTGPSFAADIAMGLPTALTLACGNDEIGADLQEQLSTANLRLYRTTDTIGAELGGALKNVIAIACGITIGMKLGESARAAVMTRGYAEIVRLAISLGARPETLSGLSGFGDLALTCTSEQSRNYRFGLALGRGESFDPTTTVEGAATAKAVSIHAENGKIDLPLTDMITAILDQKITIPKALDLLLSRPLKKE